MTAKLVLPVRCPRCGGITGEHENERGECVYACTVCAWRDIMDQSTLAICADRHVHGLVSPTEQTPWESTPMGYFSYLCKQCENSIASDDALGYEKRGKHWLMRCVVLDGYSAIVGVYDGFGKVVTEHGAQCDVVDMEGTPLMLHEACWRELGRPTGDKFDGRSKHDPHQGMPPEDVWSLPEPPWYRWKLLKRFGLRKYFLDELTGKISQVGDSGATPDRGEDGVLWVNPEESVLKQNGLWKIPVIEATTGKNFWIGADTKDEARWVADKFDMLMVGG